MISLHPILSHADLHIVWRGITDVARHSFFLSWPWIRTWLSCLPSSVQPHLLTISNGTMAVAAAILVKSNLRRSGFVMSRTWVLNATGDPALDQIFIENNGLLVREGHSDVAYRQWADSFVHEHSDWDEIKLRGVPPAMLEVWDHPQLAVRQEMELTSRFVDLDAVRAANVPFMQMLGKKTRAHIRHTRSSFEKYGPITVEVAKTMTEALVCFGELKSLHQQRWVKRGLQGAFGYPFFEIFHSALIRDHFDDGVVQLLRVKAGEQTVGVLYNFVHANDVLVYQTGFDYSLVESPNKQSPGLLTHALAIEYNVHRGHRRYDFLAGDSLYKQVLANGSEQLWWGAIQRRRAKFSAEAVLKTAWHRISGGA